LDADREEIATQLTDLETAERVLTRVGKTPPGRRLRSASAAEAKARIAPPGKKKGRDCPARRRGAAKSSRKQIGERQTQRAKLGLGRACSRPGHWQNPTRTLRGMSQRSPKPRRHRGAAPHPRGADPGARWQTLCDINRNGAGARDSLTPDHKST